MARSNKALMWSLWWLRIGLGTFLLLWALDKIVSPLMSVELFLQNYSIELSSSMVMIIGSLELTLSLMILFGMYKTFSYGFGLLIQLVSVIAYHQQIFYPFGNNHLFISELTLLFAFISLFTARHLDTHWSFSKRDKIFTRY
ncbi:MAG: hypothetical protein KC505_08335 [Myxococcales bacterium]|nr:hypothetical protein [Myxococcales bacterium]USN49840.1 MAG: hypothetical protein H6731_06055 [Myxococcales bacterium]